MVKSLRGAPKPSRKRESFIRLRDDDSDTLSRAMSRPASPSAAHLRPDQVERAQGIVVRLRDQFGSLSALERASKAAGFTLKQQTMSALLGNDQLGYRIAEAIMGFARTLPEFREVPSNYILDGAVESGGTEPASYYALRPMRYRAKGELLDRLSRDLPSTFLDFTAARDPIDPNASAWSSADWFSHVAKELELWKYLESQKIPKK